MNSEEKLYFNRQWLRKKYEGELLSSVQIGHICGVHANTILYQLERFRIKRRKRGRIKKLRRKTVLRLPIFLIESMKKTAEDSGRSMTEIQEIAIIEYLMRQGINPFKDNQDANI